MIIDLLLQPFFFCCCHRRSFNRSVVDTFAHYKLHSSVFLSLHRTPPIGNDFAHFCTLLYGFHFSAAKHRSTGVFYLPVLFSFFVHSLRSSARSKHTHTHRFTALGDHSTATVPQLLLFFCNFFYYFFLSYNLAKSSSKVSSSSSWQKTHSQSVTYFFCVSLQALSAATISTIVVATLRFERLSTQQFVKLFCQEMSISPFFSL